MRRSRARLRWRAIDDALPGQTAENAPLAGPADERPPARVVALDERQRHQRRHRQGHGVDEASFAPVTARRYSFVFDTDATGMGSLGTPAEGVDAASMIAAMSAFARGALHIAELRLSGDVRIDQFETKARFSVARDYYALGEPADDAAGILPGQVIDLTAKLKADGTLDLDAAAVTQWRQVARDPPRLVAAGHHQSPRHRRSDRPRSRQGRWRGGAALHRSLPWHVPRCHRAGPDRCAWRACAADRFDRSLRRQLDPGHGRAVQTAARL